MNTPDGIRLAQTVPAAFESLRHSLGSWDNIALSGEIRMNAEGRMLEIIAEFQLGDAVRFGLDVQRNERGYTRIVYNSQQQQLLILRSDTTEAGTIDGFTPAFGAPLALNGQPLRLHVFVDESSVEVLAQDGLAAITAQTFVNSQADGLVGKVLVFGEALAANTLEDLDLYHEMANRMGCSPLFTTTEWVDVRLSRGANGSFLFVNNYPDDPVETVISEGAPLFGGHSLILPARRGAILPLEWHLKPGIVLHYITSEITAVIDEAVRLVFKTAQPEFFAELSLTNYACDESFILQRLGTNHLQLHCTNGVIELTSI